MSAAPLWQRIDLRTHAVIEAAAGTGKTYTIEHLLARLLAEDARVHAMWSPLSGRVMEINETVLSNPRLASEDPMGRGWLMRIDPTAMEYEVENLL